MPPRLVPAASEIAKFATPLNPGERLVLDRLVEVLDDQWTVYVQPHVLNLQPDFVLLSAQHGLVIVEVKDWTDGGHKSGESGRLSVLTADNTLRTSDEDPLAQAHRYRSELNGRVVSPPGEDHWTSVRACVVLPRWATSDAQTLLGNATRLKKYDAGFIAVFGSEFFEGHHLARFVSVIKHGANGRGRGFSSGVMQRLRARLDEPEAVAEQRAPLKLSAGARDVATNPSGATIRRVRGPAGSGKSLGLAARAAQLAGQGKDVLVLTFNVTLAHYVQDLVRRHAREINADHRKVDCTHFHGFCHWVVGAEFSDSGRDDYFEQLFRTARHTYEHSPSLCKRYDAILVDEGQDFEQEWWNFLRRLVRKDQSGEMILAVDVAQDIYTKRSWGNEDSMRGCGFRGKWTDLEGSYRLPVDLSPVLSDFVARYLPDKTNRPAVPVDHSGIASEPTVRRWRNLTDTRPAIVAATVKEELERILEHETPPHPADVTILVGNHDLGLHVVNGLTEIEHIFAKDEMEQRERKKQFWPGTAKMKASTIHSFKGWESRAVLIVIGDEWSLAEASRLAYVAMSRVKGDPSSRSAFLTVLNCNRGLDDFQARFEREVTIEEAPGLGGDRRLPIERRT